MIKNNFVYKCLYVICLFILIKQCDSSIFDYFPFIRDSVKSSFLGWNDKTATDLSLHKVPYEIEVTDEKFIEQAATFTGVTLSDLDKCQHRVVYKLQTECHKLNDEDLAKLAVKLLNCQSEIEGRTVYPCTEQMPIRECTSSMDPDTWNSYLLMSNRARAVCYSIRQAQFRGLTELTVNKLMDTAHEQIHIMSHLKDGQHKIEKTTIETFENVVRGNEVLRQQQNDIQEAQLFGQLSLEDNIRRLADEKQLIIEGHEYLAKMTQEVKTKLVEASKQLDAQSEERKDNHKEILNDLIKIQKQAQQIFARIEESSRHMLEQSALAAKKYEATLAQLAQVNSTVYALVDVVSATKTVMEEKMKWLSEALGGTDDAVERLYLFVSHISYLILAMISCAFLQVSVPSRIALVVLVPLNLIVTLQQGATNALTFIGLSIVLLTFIFVESIIYLALSFMHKKSVKSDNLSIEVNVNETPKRNGAIENTLNSTTLGDATLSDSFSYRNGYSTYKRYGLDTPDNRSERDDDFDDFAHPTPPMSRQSRSRSKTPQLIASAFDRPKCGAATRMGTPCKSIALLGRDYCFRHQTGSSVIGE